MSLSLTDPQGRCYRIIHGWGTSTCHSGNLFRGHIDAEAFVGRLSNEQISDIARGFFGGVDHRPRHLRETPVNRSVICRVATPTTTLTLHGRIAEAICQSHLVVQADNELPPFDDPRSVLRMEIRQALSGILMAEQREAAALQAQMDQESSLNKGRIYTGAAMTGLVKAAWGLVVWAKDVTDLVNPVVRMHNQYTSARDAWGADNFFEEYSKRQKAAEWREVVEVIGFDPSQITSEQLTEAMDVVDLIWSDTSMRNELKLFAWNYAKAQHAVELTEMGGGAVFEIILTAVLAALTGGVGAVAATASKARHMTKFKKLGELFVDFAKATKRAAAYAKDRAKRAAKTRDYGDLKTDMPAVDRKGDKPKASPEKPKSESISTKKYHANNLVEAEARLAERRNQIAREGYKPKYTDDELAYMAQNGDVGSERFQVRFIETKYLVNRDTPAEHLSGAMGMTMEGATGKGSKYWSTSLDQLEDADTDPRLIAEKLGLEYNPKADYTLIIVDTEKAAPLTGVKSVPATFEKVGEFANQELPKDFPKDFTDKVMTPEFQAEYAKHYQAAVDQIYLKNAWSKDSKGFEKYLKTTGMSQDEIAVLKQRMKMHEKIGNNQDYVGNGLTKDINAESPNTFGAVETLNFERKEVNLNQLNDADAIKILPSLKLI